MILGQLRMGARQAKNAPLQFPLYQLTQRDGILVTFKQGDELAFFTLPLLVISRCMKSHHNVFLQMKLRGSLFLLPDNIVLERSFIIRPISTKHHPHTPPSHSTM